MVKIRELCQQDKNLIFEWMRNADLRDNIGTQKKPNLKSHNIWFEKKINDRNNKTMIIEFNGIAVGLIGTNYMDRINKNAEIFLYIGDTSFKKRGVGCKSLTLFCEYLIKHFNMHKINARVFSFNMPSINLFFKCGFALEGIQKHQIWNKNRNGFFDVYLFGYING